MFVTITADSRPCNKSRREVRSFAFMAETKTVNEQLEYLTIK